MPGPVCLPFDDWAEHLDVPSLTVRAWSGETASLLPPADTALFVPPYMAATDLVAVFAAMPRLEVVQTLTAGYEDVLAVLPPDVTLCNARGVHDASTAELAVGLTIASLRGFADFVRAQDEERWDDRDRTSLADRQVVVVGAGSVGGAIAARLAPFECHVELVGRTARPGVRAVAELPGLLPGAEVVILAVPHTPQTERMVDAAFLSLMPDGALLVNVARGAVVDTEALLAELRAGRLVAALDVTDPEPLPPGHPLWHAPGVLVSPHVGGNSSAFVPRAWRMLQAQLARYAAGAPLEHVVAGPGAGG